ncbi:MAG TPA: MBOAT family O-acyltransferase [Edaphobacter sp.]|jgi:D-alanyl-lipoteichoic acid acyltransferase DltB (MBOAT superfamily)|nr:MBOAT family O-acyltransferase [Edaphobacter sp.]
MPPGLTHFLSNSLLLVTLAVPFLLFPLAAWIVLRLPSGKLRMAAFALVNLVFALAVCISRGTYGVRLHDVKQYFIFSTSMFAVYVLLVAVQYLLLEKKLGSWLPLFFPILILVLVKYVPRDWTQNFVPAPFSKKVFADFFLGLSYMAFRLTYMVHEIRNGVAPMPSFSEYLSFAFFVPTLSIGPINPYSAFHNSITSPDRSVTPIGRSWARILIGLTKYVFLGNLANQLSYDGLLADGLPHHLIDFPIAVAGYCAYLYLNFSGFCDIAIGVSGLLGIHVQENFDRPFSKRNLQEFWAHWHITLTNYMRDMVFVPLSKALVRRFGPASAPGCIALAITVVFVLMGIWHGAGWNFVIYGMWHAVGVVTVHYYTLFLKKRLGKARYAKYRENRVIYHIANAVTLAYFALGLIFVANSMRGLKIILGAFRPM